MDLLGTTILRHPAWYSDSVFEEVRLPFEASEYKVTAGIGSDGRWLVERSNGDVVYGGIGPVTPAPA